jgi:transcriptional regulator with XRE-family HTH domain
MAHAQLPSRDGASIGPLLCYWRKTRGLSQLALAHTAEVSPRHLCFLETGRARPSREMVLHLAHSLDVPLRERNALLLAAGFAPLFRESGIDSPDLAAVRAALDAILAQQEPYPAVVMNRCWDIVSTNGAADRFFGLFLDAETAPSPANVLRLMFHPRGLRPHVANWESVAGALVQRLHREAVGGVLDASGRGILDEILGYPGVPSSWAAPDLASPLVPVLPVAFRHGDRTFRFFSTVTVLGTPQDVTLQELRIECFFPSDDGTARAARELARLGAPRPAGNAAR